MTKTIIRFQGIGDFTPKEIGNAVKGAATFTLAFMEMCNQIQSMKIAQKTERNQMFLSALNSLEITEEDD
jgi:hypothetical protein